MFVLVVLLIAYGQSIVWWPRGISEPAIDLILSIGIGLLTAFLALLAGHVATEKHLYRWLFWVGGIMLAMFFVITGVRTYRVASSAKTPEQIVMTAVQEANGHTDRAIDVANMHTDSEVGKVRDDLSSVRRGLESISSQFNQGAADLKESISKVGKPDPPIPANIQFSLWSETMPLPILRSTLRPDKDGIYTVEFVVTNLSDTTTAHLIDTWVDLCMDCSFATEPQQFGRPAGMRDQTRYRRIEVLNPGASTEKQSLQIRFAKPGFTNFEIGWRSSCEVCGKGMQFAKATIDILKAAVP